MVLDSLSAGDRANLREVYARSAMLLDLGQCEAWADLFETHAIVRGTGGTAAASQFSGRPALLKLARDTFEGRFNLALGSLSPAVRCHHVLSNVCLYTDGTHHARAYAHLLVTTRGGHEAPRWLAAGIFSDRLSKCGSGCWRFQSRTLTLNGTGVASDGAAPPLRRTA